MTDHASLAEVLLAHYSLAGKRVWLWGVGGALGSALVREFCLLGAHVGGASLRAEELEQAAAAATGTPGSYFGGVLCDITVKEEVDTAAAKATQLLAGHPLDICLLVAGGVGYVVGPQAKFHEGDFEAWKATVELNYLGPVYAAIKTIPLMLEAPSPVIGAICSMSYEGNLTRTGPYRNAKRALHDFIYWLTPEVSKLGPAWRVLGWQPGFVMANQNRGMLDELRKKAVTNHLPRGEWQSAAAVARGIAATCTPAFSEAHGCVIPLAAGYPCAGLGMDVL